MKETITPNGQVVSDGRTVWVNSVIDGRCLARFCKFSLEIMPITSTLQVDSEPTRHDGHDFTRFKNRVQGKFGVAIGDQHEPKFSRDDIERAHEAKT